MKYVCVCVCVCVCACVRACISIRGDPFSVKIVIEDLLFEKQIGFFSAKCYWDRFDWTQLNSIRLSRHVEISRSKTQ
jgi:hypothetical protein